MVLSTSPTVQRPQEFKSARPGRNQPQDSPTAIEIADLNAYYGDFQALHQVNIRIPQTT